MMEDDKFNRLLREIGEIRKSQQDSEAKLDGTLKDFQKEISATQEKTMKELSLKISKSGYTFQKKVHEHQFNFNSGVQESIASTRSEIQKLSSDSSDKDTLSKADAQGEKALSKRQKHIMIADSSDWGAVWHYEADHWLMIRMMRKGLKEPRRPLRRRWRMLGLCLGNGVVVATEVDTEDVPMDGIRLQEGLLPAPNVNGHRTPLSG